jgi:hypothetical protein
VHVLDLCWSSGGNTCGDWPGMRDWNQTSDVGLLMSLNPKISVSTIFHATPNV